MNGVNIALFSSGMWKRLFCQPLPLPAEPGLYFIYELADKHDYQN